MGKVKATAAKAAKSAARKAPPPQFHATIPAGTPCTVKATRERGVIVGTEEHAAHVRIGGKVEVMPLDVIERG